MKKRNQREEEKKEKGLNKIMKIESIHFLTVYFLFFTLYITLSSNDCEL